ncbi:hypothetical protein D3870_17885 [Noviherbaspirillum cavernae]|uniref:Uncharacterized protein n=1 Tax=Noviherbaspirillum cavernae TaxID=2320862 RepID=A0A418X553_9BURK|nr:hypothetical protein [Noviherbaspirillum cavernae]RJG07618.1 hypothetical protein D3870_17885 [Noviherbaspirillum cavernae]
MFEMEAIYQRTPIGRDEIYHKAHGLTQSERRILITVDGSTPYRGLCAKLSGLAQGRIDRALSLLLKKGLVFEVLLPLDSLILEQLDEQVVDRFLQQDPLDPVTIISYDPEEDFGHFSDGVAQPMPRGVHVALPQESPGFGGVAPLLVSAIAASPALEAGQGSEAVRGNTTCGDGMSGAMDWESALHGAYSMPIRERLSLTNSLALIRQLHWGYWAIAIGLCLIGSPLFAKMIS